LQFDRCEEIAALAVERKLLAGGIARRAWRNDIGMKERKSHIGENSNQDCATR